MLVHLTRAKLLRLAAPAAEPCLSIYLPVGEEGGRLAATRLRQLLRHLQDHLPAQGLGSATSARLVDAVWALADDLEHQANDHAPLVYLARPDHVVVERLPDPVPELAVLGTRLHLKPLLPLVTRSPTYALLALSKGEIRLFHGVGASLTPLALPGAPAGLDAFLQNTEFAPQRQLHPGIPGQGGARGAIFHGQGDAADHLKPQLQHYCRQIDRALHEVLPDPGEPLVLCGVDYLLAIYRAISRHPTILDATIVGSPERLAPAELGTRAWAIVRPSTEQAQRAAVARYATVAASAPAHVCTALRQLLPAAAAGQVETAFVAIDREQWGHYDEATGHVLLHETQQALDEDLLNSVALETLRHGGSAYVLPAEALPGGGLCAATLRAARPVAGTASARHR
ncbi:MAG: hypothetical protein HGA45_06245 [Chloroflexales bacterium]|nr:hypothetical protein [Chloroflexales bacterium]